MYLLIFILQIFFLYNSYKNLYPSKKYYNTYKKYYKLDLHKFKKIEKNLIKLNLIKNIQNKYIKEQKLDLLKYLNKYKNIKFDSNKYKTIQTNLIKLDLIKKIKNKYNYNKLELLKPIHFNNKDLEYYNISKKDLLKN